MGRDGLEGSNRKYWLCSGLCVLRFVPDSEGTAPLEKAVTISKARQSKLTSYSRSNKIELIWYRGFSFFNLRINMDDNVLKLAEQFLRLYCKLSLMLLN